MALFNPSEEEVYFKVLIPRHVGMKFGHSSECVHHLDSSILNSDVEGDFNLEGDRIIYCVFPVDAVVPFPPDQNPEGCDRCHWSNFGVWVFEAPCPAPADLQSSYEGADLLQKARVEFRSKTGFVCSGMVFYLSGQEGRFHLMILKAGGGWEPRLAPPLGLRVATTSSLMEKIVDQVLDSLQSPEAKSALGVAIVEGVIGALKFIFQNLLSNLAEMVACYLYFLLIRFKLSIFFFLNVE